MNSICRNETPFIKSIIPLPVLMPEENGAKETAAGQLFRTRRPDASVVNFAALRERKITHIINLLSAKEENEVLTQTSEGFERLFLPEIYRSQGFYQTAFPIPDFGVPDPQELSRLIDAVLERLRGGENIAIHCRSGCGRTGLVVACLAGKVFGLLGKAAILWAREYIPGAVDTAKQEAFICDFLKTHVPPEASSKSASLFYDHPSLQIATLIELAEIARERGDLIEWKAKFGRAKEIAFSIKAADVRFEAWNRIFYAELKEGNEAAEDALIKCWLCAMKIQNPSKKAMAYLWTARAFEMIGRRCCIEEVMESAEVAANEVKDLKMRADSFVAIARRYREGSLDEAVRLAGKVLEIVRILENRADRLDTLISLASLAIDDPRMELTMLTGMIISIAEDPAPVPAEEYEPLVKTLSNFARLAGEEVGVRLIARADALFKEIIDPSSRDEAYYYLRKAKMKLELAVKH